MNNFFLLTFFSALILFPVNASADKDSSGRIFFTGLRFHSAYYWPHSRAVAPIGEAFPVGIQAEFSWLHTGEKTWNQCNCYPLTGFHITWFNFNKPGILGNGYTAACFIEPLFSVHRKINFSLRGAAGIAWLTTPYDSVENPMNLAYSMRLNGFVMIHLGAYFIISNNLKVNLTANINHISNGGIKQPNKGINFPGVSAGVAYSLNPQEISKRERTGFANSEKKYRKDLSFFVSGKTLVRELDIYYPVLGTSILVSRQVGKISALTASADWMTDYALREKMKLSNREGIDFNRGGILFGHEFLMGRFALSQQLGVYLYDPSHENDPVYQRYGLLYKAGKHFLFGINLKAHRHVADFLDARIGWSW
ncbi:MAG: acyloxyacyl hydrolase [Bacteroidetes bacterium]|nr:acyloxyacyl hydrolase [Bacteroidota bacterium]